MGNVATYLQLDVDASMAITTISSREFNQDTSRAKKAAEDGPVFITDRGRPAHVLITIEEYQRLTGGPMTLAEALAQSGGSDFEFDPPKIKGRLSKPVDLS
jgi:prevent-host-death family protein